MKKTLSWHNMAHMSLRRIEQYATVSPFCKRFYRAIHNWLGEPGLDARKLDHAFHLFLRCESQRHQAVGCIVRKGALDLIEIMRVGRTACKSLSRICRALERTEPAGPREAMIRELIMAECAYHLGRTEAVVRSLRRAIRLGCDHSLVHFALGYNLYHSALERFTCADKYSGHIRTSNSQAFENACRQAIGAFECGLQDAEFDAHICWWIGLISEILEDRAGAYRAYVHAMNVDPDNFASMVAAKLRNLDPSLIIRSPVERERLLRLPPITDDEVNQARELLADLNTFPTFFLDADDS